MTGFGPELTVTCANHRGPGVGLMTQWDAEAKTWVKLTDFIASDEERDPAADRGGRRRLPRRDRRRAARLPGAAEPACPRPAGRGLPLEDAAMLDARRATLLEVNNIEVIYDHVILVLKGVSLSGPRGRHHRAARRQRRRQDHDAEGDLEPAALRARRDHQGPHPLPRRERRRPVAGGPGAQGRDPGDGGPPLLRAPDGRGEPADRRLHPPRRRRGDRRRPGDGLRLLPPAEGAPALARPATPPAASSRCAPSAAR